MVYITKHGTCNSAIKDFVGLKFKICILTTEDNHESKKLKAIKKNVVNDELKYEDYKNVLFNRSYTRHEMNRIQSKDHDPVILAVTASVHFDYKSTFLSAVYPLFRVFGSVSSWPMLSAMNADPCVHYIRTLLALFLVSFASYILTGL